MICLYFQTEKSTIRQPWKRHCVHIRMSKEPSLSGMPGFSRPHLLSSKATLQRSEEAKQQLIDTFQPYIAKLDYSAPGFAKLRRSHVAFTQPDKPIVRTDKGTVKRAATTKLYEKEIDQIYADAENATDMLSTVQLDARDKDGLVRALRPLLLRAIGSEELSNEQDIFAAGADLLQVMNIVRQLRAALKEGEGGIPANLITPRFVYSNPTVYRLAAALHSLIKHGNKP